MPQVIVYLEEKENNKIIRNACKWRLSKADTIKKIINDFIEGTEIISEEII